MTGNWGVTADEAPIYIKAALGRCSHAQAEPVILCTGELVACICITCLDKLPFHWISKQREHAELVAYCTHENLDEIRELGKLRPDYHCASCGEWNPTTPHRSGV